MLCCYDIIPTILFYLNIKDSVTYLITCKDLYSNLNNMIKLRLIIKYNINFELTNIVNIARWLDINTECIYNLSKYVDINGVIDIIIDCNHESDYECARDRYIADTVWSIVPLCSNNTLFELNDIYCNLMDIKIAYDCSTIDNMISNSWSDMIFYDLVYKMRDNTMILGIPIVEIFNQLKDRKWNEDIDKFDEDVLQLIESLGYTNKLDIDQLVDAFVIMENTCYYGGGYYDSFIITC